MSDTPHGQSAFHTAEEFIAAVDDARRHDHQPPDPVTRAEFLALADEFPDLARRYRPADPFWLEYMGLPRHYGLPIKPLDELWQERFLTTLDDDDDFRAAVAHLVLRGAVQ
ncbi:MAG: hypothetical protein ACE5KM_13955 [Planctomycetaceae bacterium]